MKEAGVFTDLAKEIEQVTLIHLLFLDFHLV